MSNSRDFILNKLKKNPAPFPEQSKVENYLPMVKLEKKTPESLLQHFKSEAEKLSAQVTICNSEKSAEETFFKIIGNEIQINCWSAENLPLKNFYQALKDKGIEITENESVRIGVTGVNAALAATGSIVLASGKGRQRTASLLPEVHIALIKKGQIFADFESWIKECCKKGLEDFTNPSNTIVISGPSRTADISMELVLGMHGPKGQYLIIY
ncbi:lactate utilization protein [candidate division KSB1 bacterium]|nr:lactate utilization protein [candidate division KSB1 bacterium]